MFDIKAFFQRLWQKWKDFKFTRAHAKTLAIVITVLTVLVVAVGLIIHFEVLNKTIVWVDDNKIAGAFIIGLCFIIICFPFALGYFLLGLTAGYIYDIGLGILIMSVSSAIGSCLVFYICHTTWRSRMERFLSGKPKLEMFMKAIKENGWKLVLLGRVTPIPIGLVNVIYGVSGISFRTFAIASVAGLLPEQVMITFLGTKMGSLSDIISGEREMEQPEKIALILELVLLVALFIFVGYIGKRVMKKVEAESARREQELEGVTTSTGEGVGEGEGDGETQNAEAETSTAFITKTIGATEYTDKSGLLNNEEMQDDDDNDDEDDNNDL